MTLELLGIAAFLLLIVALLIMTVAGKFRHVSSPRVNSAQAATLGSGLRKAAGIFFLIGLVVGIGCFLLAPAVGAFAVSGIFTLAIVLWIIGKCVP